MTGRVPSRFEASSEASASSTFALSFGQPGLIGPPRTNPRATTWGRCGPTFASITALSKPLRTETNYGREIPTAIPRLMPPFRAALRYNDVRPAGWGFDKPVAQGSGEKKDSHSDGTSRRVARARGKGAPPGAS